MADFDEQWLRLALVIHEASTDALRDVLNYAILKKHTDLACESFENKLSISLKRDEQHLQKFFLAFELLTVFPTSGCPGTYEMFDVGIVGKLIQYFVGVAVWDSEAASLPCKVMPGSKKPVIDLENLQTSHLNTASKLALAKVIGVYRNFVFHHTGSPQLSTETFNLHWDNLVVTLQRLDYDVKNVSGYKSGPLDYKSRLVVDSIKDLFHEAISSIREELASNDDITDLKQFIINGLKYIGCWVRKLESDVLAEVDDLLAQLKALQTSIAGRKEINDLQGMLETEIVAIEGRMHVMESEISAQKEMMLNFEMGLTDVRQKVHACIQNRNTTESTLQERKQRAQEACKSTHERLLKLKELDIFGRPIEDVRKTDLMVSLVTVKCGEIDTSRLESAHEIQKFLTGNVLNSKAVATQDLFKTDEFVLLRGYPGAGKSTLCHYILGEWNAERLWSDQYDFVFYVNAPYLVTIRKEQRVDTESVLNALYPDVFSQVSYKELKMFKCLIIVDAIDECGIEKICASGENGSFEEAIKKMITCSESKFHRLVLGRPSACDAVRTNLLQNVNFEFVEVVGFTLEQVKEYVGKFCLHDKSKPENLWQRISDNNTLLQMAHLPIFANVICNVLSEKAKVAIKTETELYVWLYFLLLTRHRIREHGDKLKPSTFEELFKDEKVMDELVKVSKIAYESLSEGEFFFSSRALDLTGMGTTFVSPFIVGYEKYLSFLNFTVMEFFAAVHLFVTSAALDRKTLGAKHLQRVVVMLFGLLGGAVKNSDSAPIVRDFVQPLMEKFRMKPLEVHPLCADIVHCNFRVDDFHHFNLYVNLCFEIQNALLLRDQRFKDIDLAFAVEQHYQLDQICFFMKHVVIEKLYLGIAPSDRRFSKVECRKLRDSIMSHARNIDQLDLFFAISEEKMSILAPALVLVRSVFLVGSKITEESWQILVLAVQNSVRNHTRRIGGLGFSSSCNIPAHVSVGLERLGIKCTEINFTKPSY